MEGIIKFLTSNEGIELIKVIGISTIITTIFTFISNSKKNNLDYITKERSDWRKEMREIAVKVGKIEVGSQNQFPLVRDVMHELKVRINGYGKAYITPMGMSEIKKEASYYLEDGHIWEVIEKLENYDLESPPENDPNDLQHIQIAADTVEFNKNKKLLVNYLSALLKFDWERSKQEIGWEFSKLIKPLLNSVGVFFIFWKIWTKLSEIALRNEEIGHNRWWIVEDALWNEMLGRNVWWVLIGLVLIGCNLIILRIDGGKWYPNTILNIMVSENKNSTNLPVMLLLSFELIPFIYPLLWIVSKWLLENNYISYNAYMYVPVVVACVLLFSCLFIYRKIILKDPIVRWLIVSILIFCIWNVALNFLEVQEMLLLIILPFLFVIPASLLGGTVYMEKYYRYLDYIYTCKEISKRYEENTATDQEVQRTRIRCRLCTKLCSWLCNCTNEESSAPQATEDGEITSVSVQESGASQQQDA